MNELLINSAVTEWTLPSLTLYNAQIWKKAEREQLSDGELRQAFVSTGTRGLIGVLSNC